MVIKCDIVSQSPYPKRESDNAQSMHNIATEQFLLRFLAFLRPLWCLQSISKTKRFMMTRNISEPKVTAMQTN